MQAADQTALARAVNGEAPAAPKPQNEEARPLMAARPQDLFDSLHHAQAAFSACLDRYLEL